MNIIKLEKLLKNVFFLLSLLITFFASDIVYKDYVSNKINSCLNSISCETTDSVNTSNDSIPATKRIALTFDDGPHPIYTIKLLDGLKERGVKATFFILGTNAANNSDILKRMSEEGHLIGNHTFSHVQLSKVSVDKAINEINDTNSIIEGSTGVAPRFIRPPYGSLPRSLQAETNLIPVLWSIDPRDWCVLNTDSVVKHVVSKAKDGDIILLHDIFETSVDAALIIADQLSAQGFTFVTVDQLTEK